MLTARVGVEVLKGLLQRCKVGENLRMTQRAWPMDCDIFMHINNGSFVRLAELARWRVLSASGLLKQVLKTRTVFLVAEQTVTYKKQLPLGRRYLLETSVAADQKWLWYTHRFTSVDGATEYAIARVRAVLKAPSGKTVLPSEAVENSPWLQDQLTRNS